MYSSDMNDTEPDEMVPGSLCEGRRIMTELHRATAALEQRVEAALATVGLSSPKLSVLTRLVESREPVTLGELAGRLCCVRSNVTQLIDRMEVDGLVRRVSDPGDRRSVRAELTSMGRQRQAAGIELLRVIERDVLGKFSTDDRQRLLGLLEGLC
jgi:DNA-binding MarR family transcriptional regulator